MSVSQRRMNKRSEADLGTFLTHHRRSGQAAWLLYSHAEALFLLLHPVSRGVSFFLNSF